MVDDTKRLKIKGTSMNHEHLNTTVMSGICQSAENQEMIVENNY